MKNFTILTFSKVMAFILITLATSNLMFAVAADVATIGLSWESIRTSIIQWLIGVLAASLTIIVGYVANLIRHGVTHLYDMIRTYIANTQILEVITDLKDFCLNETTAVEAMAQKALQTNNDIDDKELQEIAQKVVSDAVAMWGEKKITYLEKYRPMVKEWLTLKAKAFIQEIIDRFRTRQSETNIVVNK